MFKHLIAVTILCMSCMNAVGQGIDPHGSPMTKSWHKGVSVDDSGRISYKPKTFNRYFDSLGLCGYSKSDSSYYYYDGRNWVKQLSDKDSSRVKAWAQSISQVNCDWNSTSGVTQILNKPMVWVQPDSNVVGNPITLSYYYSHLPMAVDSARYSTVYRNDTAKTAIRGQAALNELLANKVQNLNSPNTTDYTSSGCVNTAVNGAYVATGDTAVVLRALIATKGTVTSITAGTGLSGGTITTSGTISMPNVGTAGTYGSSSGNVVPVITTDAQGRVSGVTTYSVAVTAGTVTSVATNSGTGITGGTITGSGTIAADTNLLSTKANRQKAVDSLNVNISAKGVGSVTSVSIGNLTPLFTSSVSNASTTPAITYTLTPVPPSQFLGGATSGTVTPTYRALVAGDIPQIAYSSLSGLPSLTLTVNGTNMLIPNAYTITASANTLTSASLNPTVTTSSLSTFLGSATFAGNVNVASTFGYNTNGVQSLWVNQATGPSVFVGNAGNSQTSSPYMVAVGYQALKSLNNSSGFIAGNCALGFQTLFTCTSGAGNMGIGTQALYRLTTGNGNCVVGDASVYAVTTITTGSNNTIIGQAGDAGNLITTGSNNTYIGPFIKGSGVAVNNEIVIGGGAAHNTEQVGNGSNTVTIGNSSVTDFYAGGTGVSKAHVGGVAHKLYTYATLPTPAKGDTYVITDATVTTGTVSVGGGTNTVFIGYGTAWTVIMYLP